MKTTKTIELSYSEIAKLIEPMLKERVRVLSLSTCKPSWQIAMQTPISQPPEETLKIEIEVAQ